MSKLPPLIKKKLQVRKGETSFTANSLDSLIGDFDFTNNTVVLTYDLARILQVHLDSLLNSSFDGIPYLRMSGIDLSDYLFSLSLNEIKDVENRLRKVFSQSSLFEFLSLNELEQISPHTIKLTFTLKVKVADKILLFEALLNRGQPAQFRVLGNE